MKLILIGLAGALGSIARYLLSGWAANWWGTAFPFGTLAVNIIGSFLIGMIMQIGLDTSLLSPTSRAVLTIGFVGGFTTYSSFNYETIAFLQEGEFMKAIFNTFGMLVLCGIAGVLGIAIGKWLVNVPSYG